MEPRDVIDRIARQLETKPASTLFVNGAPGSGKTYLQAELARDLPKEIPRLRVLGPYTAHPGESIGRHIVGDLYESGYLQEPAEADVTEDVNSTWRWLKGRLVVSSRQAFAVLIDLEQVGWVDHESLRVWFSSTRYLEHLWDAEPPRLVVLITSSWDHTGLEEYYGQIGLSFPYTSGRNYMVWEGISARACEQMLTLDQHADMPSRAIHGRLLHEVAGGHPGAIKDILAEVDLRSLSVQSVLSATHKAAQEGPAARGLLEVWKELPTDSLLAIERLLAVRQMPTRMLATQMDRLRAAGIVVQSEVLAQQYARLSCWYTELVLRHHARELGIQDELNDAVSVSELMPVVSELHFDAYRLINEIENLLRNFVVVHLSRAASGNPLLAGHCVRRDKEDGQLRDAQARAEEFRQRATRRGLPVQLNPIVAYLSLQDLAGILIELPQPVASSGWQSIANALTRLAYIRDAVMHNQMIEVSDLQKIYTLYGEIMSLLGEESVLAL